MNKDLHDYYYKKLRDITYSKQDHWDVFKNLFFQKISEYKSIESLRSNGLSNMLETGLPSEDLEETLKGKNYSTEYGSHEVDDIKKRFDQLIEMMGDELLEIPFNSLVGRPRHYKHNYKDKIFNLNFDDLYHVYSSWQIKRLLKAINQNPPSNILEIGAGYGNLAFKLKSIFKYSRYIIIDLPEVLLLQHHYLYMSNPDLKIMNLLDHSSGKNIDINTLDFDIILIPFTIFKDIKNIKFELAINTRSFGEMPRIIMEDYIKWIEKNISEEGLLYNTNRYVFTKSKDKNKVRNYPYDNYWETIISQPQWLQTHLHEFLLQRKNIEVRVPLSITLKSFPIKTPPPGPIMENIQTQEDWLKVQGIKS